MSEFDREMKRATNEIEKALEKAIRGASIELFGEIVKRTPVGNPSLWKNPAPAGYVGGRLRGNWQTSLVSLQTKELDFVDRTGRATTARGATTINKFQLKDRTIWFSNNLPYAERVELGWSHKQRPQGMVRTTVKTFEPIMDNIARKHKI